jgi:hypothetical protein
MLIVVNQRCTTILFNIDFYYNSKCSRG